ncbi:short-subunit dehydrogenase involved in D-alanine esterification of teichoic acids [Paraburkholderia sp. WC7.3d]
MTRFQGKSVLVTGGSSGIGLATAKAFATEGARVVITGRDAAALEEATHALGADAVAIRNDAGSVAAARELASALGNANIELDAAFFNAGAAIADGGMSQL